jgi:hypothetical protein
LKDDDLFFTRESGAEMLGVAAAAAAEDRFIVLQVGSGGECKSSPIDYDSIDKIIHGSHGSSCTTVPYHTSSFFNTCEKFREREASILAPKFANVETSFARPPDVVVIEVVGHHMKHSILSSHY